MQIKGTYIPGALFGELTHITQKKWRHSTVFALEPTTLLVFNNMQLSRVLKDASAKAGFQDLLHFLDKIFPDFCSLSSTNQRKIIDSFKPVEFLPGQIIIKEGEIGDKAYLIKEGECLLQSNKNPLTAFDVEKVNVDVSLKTMRGFMSQSTNTLHFGILEANQWAGEERLLKKDESPFPYSIIAKTAVKAFEITRQDARRKLPKDLMMFLIKVAEQRFRFIEHRTKYLIEKTQDVADMDPSKAKYDQSMAEYQKKFPAANPYVITNIRKKKLLIKSDTAVTMPPINKSLDISKNYMTLQGISMNKTSEKIDPSKTLGLGFKSHNLLPIGRFSNINGTMVSENKSTLMNMRTMNNTTMPFNRTMSDFTGMQQMNGIRSPQTKMTIASSIPRILGYGCLVPKFKKPAGSINSKSEQISAYKAMNMLSERQLKTVKIADQMEDSMNQFSVGSRTIMLINQLQQHVQRPNTPKLNYLASARLKPGY